MKSIKIVFLLLFIISNSNAQNYSKNWENVIDSEEKGLIKTADLEVDKIYKKASSRKNETQIIKCFFFKAKYMHTLEEESQSKIIDLLQNEISKVSIPSKALLNLVYAKCLQSYFEKNRYKLSRRTNTDSTFNNSMLTWSTSDFEQNIRLKFEKTLENEEELRKTSLLNYEAIFEYATKDKLKKENLLIYLLRENITYYGSLIEYNENSEIINNKILLLSPTKEFVAVVKDGLKGNSGKVYHFQQFIETQEPTAENQFNRIKFWSKYNNYFDGIDIPFFNALNRTQKEENSVHLQQKILLEKALLYKSGASKKDYPTFNQKALAILDSVIALEYRSDELNLAIKTKNEITRKKIDLKFQKHIYPDQNSRAFVEFRNTEKLKLSFFRVDTATLKKIFVAKNTNNFSDQIKKEIFKNKASLIQEYNLPVKGDCFEYSTEIVLPKLSLGTYIVSYDENTDTTNIINRLISVTNFSILHESEELTSKLMEKRFYILDRKTGNPIENANVHLEDFKLKTNNEGFVSIKLDREATKNLKVITLEKGSDFLVIENEPYYGNFEKYTKEDEYEVKVELYLDRAIYRPGQTVHYKGIAIKKKGDKKSVIPYLKLEIELEDNNYKTVATDTVECNNLGAFSGKFTLPLNGLMGDFTISANEPVNKKDKLYNIEEDEHPVWDYGDFDDSEITFKVEEYKRPKFEISFVPNIETYTIGQEITIDGRARSYSGSSVANAQVIYSIEANYDFVKTDTITTDAYGNFQILFGRESITENRRNEINYEIEVTVTDPNGETHEAKTNIIAGKEVLKLDLTVPSNLLETKNNNKLMLQSTNLNYKFVPTKGELKFYLRNNLSSKFKNRTFEQPELQSISKLDFERLFPFENYETVKNKDSLIYTLKVNTGLETTINLDFLNKYESGYYYVSFIAEDSLKNAISSQNYYFTLKNNNEKLNFEGLFELEQLNKDPKKEGFVELKLISRIQNLYTFTSANHYNGVFWQKQMTLNAYETSFKVPLDDAIDNSISINISAIFEGTYFTDNILVKFEVEDNNMALEVAVMRDKIQPNSKETWSFNIKQDNPALESELLASMYDVSLDNFILKQWDQPTFKNRYGYYTNSYQKGSMAFDLQNFSFRNLNSNSSLFEPNVESNNLIWFGFDINNMVSTSYKKQILNKQLDYKNMIWGYIRDENYEALPGAVLQVKGTTQGATSDINGFYAIKASKGEKLIISFVGFENSEIEIINQNTDIVLKESASLLQEVVVAYGVTLNKKSNLSGAVASIFFLPPDPLVDEAVLSSIEVPQIKTRTNFTETAFFFPHIKIDKDNKFNFEFTSPETLTRWKLRLLAHNSAAQSAYLEKAIVTQKELMVIPNFPRFFREKDKIVLNCTIANMTKEIQNGEAYLQLFDAKTMKSVDVLCLNKSIKKSFIAEPKGSTNVNWEISIPEGIEGLQYKIVAKSDNFSDGEENIVPVLTNNILVTESIPIWVKGNSRKDYVFENLKNNTSSTLQNHALTIEYISNPAWTVLQSLPYLIEFQHDCAEQTFSKFYGNSIASSIINSNPKISEVFENWKAIGKLNSTLEQNESLKNIILNETPWVLDAKTDTEKKQRVALLFDLEKMKTSQEIAFTKLEAKQKNNGAFAWFDGGSDNFYITQHIIAGIGHLKALKINTPNDERVNNITKKGIQFLDQNQYKVNQKRARGYSYQDFHYLYTRSFYLNEYPLAEYLKDSISLILNYYQNNWLQFSLYEKGMLALIYERFDSHETAKNILTHLKESATNNEDWGMYWIANKSGWNWYESPIETQALLIEAFNEVMHDDKSVENMKVWLLKNKQIKSWATTKATTEAMYALLMTGKDWLNSTDNAIIKIGKEKFETKKLTSIENNTGYFKKEWKKEEITKKMAALSIENKSDVPSYGGFYWQYFEDLDKIKNSSDNPLSVSKEFYLNFQENGKEVLKRISIENPLRIGDLITVRIIIKAKESVDFIHLKDMRASCFEPTNVLSHYEWKQNLSYYISTKDAATHFFFDNIAKGTHVLEYTMRATNVGNFSNGITSILSMYAPEFSSHSKGIRVDIK